VVRDSIAYTSGGGIFNNYGAVVHSVNTVFANNRQTTTTTMPAAARSATGVGR